MDRDIYNRIRAGAEGLDFNDKLIVPEPIRIARWKSWGREDADYPKIKAVYGEARNVSYCSVKCDYGQSYRFYLREVALYKDSLPTPAVGLSLVYSIAG